MRVFMNAAQRLFQVMAGHVSEVVQFFVAARQIGIQAGQPLGAHDDQLHNQGTQPVSCIYFYLQPRQRLLVNRLAEQLEAAPGRQAQSVRASNFGLVQRVATPVNGLL